MSACARATLVGEHPSVLVVEDERSFADALAIGLAREGFRVEVAADGLEALERFAAQRTDVVLLDVMLPGLSGIDVCRQLRARSRVPIIMVSARSSEIDMVVALELGADDYVAKPYRLRELVARVRAVLRRAAAEGAERSVDGTPAAPVAGASPGHPAAGPAPSLSSAGEAAATRRVVAGGMQVDLDRREVQVDGRPVALARKEFDLLAALTANAGRVLTREQLIGLVWGADYGGDTKTLDVHVKRLRHKVEADPTRPARLLTVRGVGYKVAAA